MTRFDSAVLVYLLLARSAGGDSAHPAVVAAAPTDGRTVVFTCEDHARVTVTFGDGTATLVDPHGRPFHLVQRVSGSGVAYEGDGQSLRGKGEEMIWTPAAGRRARPQTAADRCRTGRAR